MTSDRIFLIGYRGTGKTTVGRLLAARLEWTFVDADVYLESQAGKSIARIFAEDGEPVFRDLEARVLLELAQKPQHVLSTGGGVILRAVNRVCLKTQGFVVWLQAKPELVWDRLQADPTTRDRRPNLTATGGMAEIQTLMAVREPLYRETAHLALPADRSPESLVSDIVNEWNGLFNSR